MKKGCCSDNPVMALGLVRIGVGLFFAIFGAIKLFLMGPDMVAGMMTKLLGFQGGFALAVAWLVIIAELGGGIMVLAGKLVPSVIYKLSLVSFLAITIIGFLSKYVPMGGMDMMMQLLWHGMLLFAILGLMASAPRCPMGITGKSCSKESCED